ncbi:Nif3-like dinuclear metal center hexameric protein [Catenuloplanes atrovinosus]|uniref:GTP cyclohydrolase 1 type 2 homolog n=1 Tax=Catenuloplanes atrovinosus TaxID=137266 RepID=A0AAE3YUV0_9ACTN|nr:dinuclear metal center YbgI/SA1388 family protein [Catenuloplanes atrovinosus]
MTPSEQTTVGRLVDALEARYQPAWAEQWDRVGLVLGEPDAVVRRVLCVVDVVDETVDEAFEAGADLIVAHHPLLLKGVSSVAPTTSKGRIVHRLIRGGIALFTAHTNADAASPGVSDALAARLDLRDLRPLAPHPAGPELGIGRVGTLPSPRTLREFAAFAAARLPATTWGVRAAGDPDRMIRTVAVCGGAGDSFLPQAAAAGADAYLTSDLRHHTAGEHLASGGPALLDAAHWATERPWCDDVAAWLRAGHPVEVIVSDLDTDPWTLHAASPLSSELKKESSS